MNDRLYRSRDDRIITGVAGGLAERLDLDPALVRILWLVLVPLTGGFALVAYIVMAVVVPEEDGAWGPSTWGAPWSATASQAPGGPQAWPGAAAAPGTGSDPSAPGAEAAGGPAGEPPTPSWASAGTAAGPGFVPQATTRHQWREQHRAERAARHASRPAGSGSLIAGAILIVIGALFLVREYVPEFDPGRFWPFLLIAIGVILFVAAFGRHPAGPGSDIR